MSDCSEKDFQKALAKRHQFERLHADWLAARAAAAAPVDADMYDGKSADNEDACTEAARRLLSFPAIQDWMVWAKIEILDLYLCSDAAEGRCYDNRTLAAWGAIKADITRLGICGSEE